jgi:nicotinate phosphoribosyltransferase
MTQPISPIFTDLYELTMMYAYFQSGRINDEACFDLFFRTAPFQGGYIIAVGIDDALAFLNEARFLPDDIEYIRSLNLFSEDFLTFLSEWQFDGSVNAVTEGTIVFPGEPVFQVIGPLMSCQLVETALLNLINFSSLIATKSARVCSVAGWDTVLEFGARRAQGPDGALSASRAAYIGGCAGTSNLEAGKLFGIPVKGTHAHSYVMSFPSEIDSFRQYAEVFPDSAVLLIDTYDTLKSGLPHAIKVGNEMRSVGRELAGVRLDSGDLLSLSHEVRARLDSADFASVRIVASSDLDEYTIAALKKGNAPIDTFGVGTRLVTGYDCPALAGVYKLAAVRKPDCEWEMRLKVTDGHEKASLPGIKQVYRTYAENGVMVHDVVELASLPPVKDCVPLLVPALSGGTILHSPRLLTHIRSDVQKSLSQLPSDVLSIIHPAQYLVLIGPGLTALNNDLTHTYLAS